MKEKVSENLCACKEKKQVLVYCKKCAQYACGDCHITKHMDHDSEVIDLAEKCTRYLANYQRLSRIATLMADRRQIHIKDESIESITAHIKDMIVHAKETLQGYVSKSVENSVAYLPQSPLVQSFIQKKAELTDNPNDRLAKIKGELADICKELLHNISDSKYGTADRLISPAKLQHYEEQIQSLNKTAVHEMDFIQEVRKLKQTAVQYSYDPSAVLGMIKVKTQVSKPPRVLQIDRETNLINIYNIETQKLQSTTLSLGFILPFRFVTIETGNHVYLSGGDNDHHKFLSSLYLYDELRGVFIPLADMNVPRSGHGAVDIEDKSLIVIGGESNDGPIGSCERYTIADNVWTAAPPLNEVRCGLGACAVGNKAIFAIGGWNQDYIGSIERLELSADATWEVLKLAKKNVLTPLQMPSVVSVSDSQILIFGGYEEEEKLSDTVWLLDISKRTTQKVQALKASDAFFASETRVVQGVVYAFGYNNGGIHSYNIALDQWNFVPQHLLPH